MQKQMIFLKHGDIFSHANQCCFAIIFQECANMIALNAVTFSGDCAVRCQMSVLSGETAQSPAPECELSDCLTCANEFSYPIFETFAGRDPHRSGILAGYAYPCSEDVDITHAVCPDFAAKDVQPTYTSAPLPALSMPPSSVPEPVSSGNIVFSGLVNSFLVFSLFFGIMIF